MAVLLIVVLVLVGLILVVLIAAAMKPDEFRMQRSTRINASADRIFAELDDFHRWPAWSPWEKLDPGMARTHGGSPKGRGATYEWEGNKKVGKGRMEITELSPPIRLLVKLDFLSPFEAHNTAEFTLQPAGNATDVTWAMYGRSPFMSKVFSVFVSMDKLIGKDFEQGLANLKAAAESR